MKLIERQSSRESALRRDFDEVWERIGRSRNSLCQPALLTAISRLRLSERTSARLAGAG
jgi:hypothetical protein